MKNNLPKDASAIISLMAINNMRFHFYKEAAGKAKDTDLKLLFMKYAVQSQAFITKLKNHFVTHHSDSLFHLNNSSPLQNIWDKFKATLLSRGRNFLLDECERLEQKAIKKYGAVTSEEFSAFAALPDIKMQVEELEEYHQALREIRGMDTKLQIA